jgi:polar amino acid transport system permease protein
MLGHRDPILGSAPLPASAKQPREAGRLAGIDPWWLLFLSALGLLIFLYVAFPERFRPMIDFIKGTFVDGDGVWMTLKLTIVSFIFIVIVGMIMGLARVSSIGIFKGMASLYVEVVRGVPVLVWLLWIYFGIPSLLLQIKSLPPELQKIPDFAAAVLAFTFAYGAYMTEVFRAGIQSISKGQMEASRSLGMNYIQAMRFIILPQAIRVILPPMSNEFVTLLKDSALVSILGLEDVTRRGREWVARYFTSFDTYLVVALMYLILTLFFTRISSAIERRMSVEKR